MTKSNCLLVASLLCASFSTAHATTVIPPTFDELVDQAEIILQGTVMDVKSQWTGEGAQRHIVSYVTFKVEDALKGAPGGAYTIRMFGGVVDGQGMAVADAPKFNVGDNDIIFVQNNGSQVIPLVGIMHGRFHVRKNLAGREIVTTNEDEPLKSVARLGKESAAVSANEMDLTPADFKAAVKDKIERGHPVQ